MPSEPTPRSLALRASCRRACTAPGSATATVWPAATLGAPQTIVAGGPPSPSSARCRPSGGRRRGAARRSARARRRSPRGDGTPWRWIASTLVPVIVRRSSIARASRAGSQYSRSQGSGTFIRTAPGSAGRSRSIRRRSGMPCLSIAIRSTPEPPGEALDLLGVIARGVGLGRRDVRVDVRVDLAGAEHLEPALALAQVAARRRRPGSPCPRSESRTRRPRRSAR